MKKHVNEKQLIFICAKRIKDLREEKGLTIEQMAELADVGVGSIHNWETAKKAPGYFSVLKLIELFDESADYIMGLTDVRWSNRWWGCPSPSPKHFPAIIYRS